MQHESLRPYVADADDLYRVFHAQHVALGSQLGLRLLACLAFMVVALLVPGAIGKTAVCLAVIAGMAWTWSMVEHVACRWGMHLLTLHDVVRPYEPLIGLPDVDPALPSTRHEWADNDRG